MKLGDLLEAMRTIVEKWPALAFVAAICAGGVLFSPDPFADQAGLLDLRQEYASVLGAVFIVSLALLGLAVAQRAWGWLARLWDARRARLELLRTLEETTPRERAVLGYCLLMEQQSITLPFGTATAELMQLRGLLLPSLGPCSALDVPYHVPIAVWSQVKRGPMPYVNAVPHIAAVADMIDGALVSLGDVQDRVARAVDRWNERVRQAQAASREGGAA